MTTKQTWEEHIEGTIGHGINREVEVAEVIRTVQAELQRQREEIVEEIRGMKEDEKGQYGKGINGRLWDAYDDGYNGALDDIIKKVEGKA